MNKEFYAIEFDIDDEDDFPLWQRTFFYALDGTVLLPVEVWIDLNTVEQTCYNDKVMAVIDYGHPYVDAEYLLQKFPELADELAETIEIAIDQAKQLVSHTMN